MPFPLAFFLYLWYRCAFESDPNREALMPKLKTNKGAAKRFKRTARGRFKRGRANASHILTKKTRKRKRSLRKSTLVDKTEQKRVARMLPYA